MSRENVEVVRLMNAAFNRGDLDEAYDFYESTAVWHSRSDEPDTGDYHGRQAIRELGEMWMGMFDEFRFELDEDFSYAGDWVVTSGWLCGRGLESGANVRERYAWAIRMNDGKFAEVWEYRDRAEALEAAGLRD
jgi:ketosteroid isomerase-like protein